MEFYNQKDVKVRKPHQCFLCYQKIQPPTVCSYEAGKYDGEFFSRYSHPECVNAWMKLNEGAYEDEWLELDEGSGAFDFKKHVQIIKEKYGV